MSVILVREHIVYSYVTCLALRNKCRYYVHFISRQNINEYMSQKPLAKREMHAIQYSDGEIERIFDFLQAISIASFRAIIYSLLLPTNFTTFCSKGRCVLV